MRRGLYRHGRAAGGERPLYDLPLDSVFDARVDIPKFFGVPDFLWVDGDGNTPTIGPTLTATGSPASGEPTPWQLEDATAVTCEEHDGATCRTETGTSMDPAAGEDVIVAALCKVGAGITNYERPISTRPTAGKGIWLAYVGGNIYGYVSGDSQVNTGGLAPALGGWSLFVLVVDRDGNTTLYQNGIASTSVATPSGDLGADSGLGLMAATDAGTKMHGGMAWATWQTGAGLADAWLADSARRVFDLTARGLGIYPKSGGRVLGLPTFARPSAASWADRNGREHLASSGLPRAGDRKSGGESGIRLAPGRTNKCYRNVNPADATGWSATGGTLDVVDDSTQLKTDGFDCWGPNVHRFAPGGGDQVMYGGAATGNTNKHAASVLLRGTVGGESVDIGVRDASGGGFTNWYTATLTTSWQRFEVPDKTPGDTDEVFALDCDAGDTILAIAEQLEEGVRCTSTIPSWATGAGAARPGESLTTPWTGWDAQGGIEAGVTPMGWSGGEAGSYNHVLIHASGGGYGPLMMDTGDGQPASSDGTTACRFTAGANPVDGSRMHVRVGWGPQQIVWWEGHAPETVTQPYDGQYIGSGALLAQASLAEVSIDNLRCFRRYGP